MTEKQTKWTVSLFLLIVGLVIFLTSWPNYYALIKTPPGFKFSGQASWFDPWDINVYVAAIRSGSTNGFLLSNAYTTAPHQPALLYPVYTLAGLLFPSSPPFLLFHILAALTTLIFLTGLFLLIRVFVKGNRRALLALFLISLAGGLGWLFFPKIQSADLFMTGFSFMSHFQRPHESLGMIGYLSSLVLFYLGVRRGAYRLSFASLGFLILTVILYPYYILSYALICGVYLLRKYHQQDSQQGRYFNYLIINLLITLPVLGIYYFHLNASQGFSGVLSQQLATPNLLNLILGYGILFPLVLMTIPRWNKNDQSIFLSSWLMASFVLAFLPLGFARFYLRGLFFPMVLLVLLNLKQIGHRLRLPTFLLPVFLIIVLPISSFYVTYKRMAEVTKRNHWYYLTESEYAALDFLKNNSAKGAGVLSWYTLGNYLPSHTDNRVYFGHLLQTPDASGKLTQVINFFGQQSTEDEARQFLDKENISYIFFGREEKAIAKSSTQQEYLNYSFLQPVFNQADITIFSFR